MLIMFLRTFVTIALAGLGLAAPASEDVVEENGLNSLFNY
jgi:hypothetical protein